MIAVLDALPCASATAAAVCASSTGLCVAAERAAASVPRWMPTRWERGLWVFLWRIRRGPHIVIPAPLRSIRARELRVLSKRFPPAHYTFDGASVVVLNAEDVDGVVAYPHLRWVEIRARDTLRARAIEALAACTEATELIIDVADDVVVATVASIGSITRLELRRCTPLSLETLQAIGRMPSLRCLHIGDIPRITVEGVGALAECAQLQQFVMRGFYTLTDDGVRSLARLQTLTSLDFGRLAHWVPHAVSDAGLQQLPLLPNLRSLVFTCGDDVTAAGLEHLRHLPALTHLDIHYCRNVSNEGIRHIAECGQLVVLRLIGVHRMLTEFLIYLPKLSHLRSLSVVYEDVPLNCSRVDHLRRIPILQQLVIENGLITDSCLGAIARIEGLTSLSMRRCGISDDDVARIGEWPNLNSLTLTDCRGMSDRSGVILSKMPSLTQLTYTCLSPPSIPPPTSAPTVRCLPLAPPLTTLSLRCAPVTDSALASLPRLTHLTHVDVAHCRLLSDEGVRYISAVPSLASVVLAGCRSMTDEGIVHLTRAVSLHTLDVSGCGVTDGGMDLIASMPTLVSVNVCGCPITERGIASLGMAKRLTDVTVAWWQVAPPQAIDALATTALLYPSYS